MNNFDDWSQIISKYLKSESDPLGSLTKYELEGDAARTAFIRAVLERFLPEIYGIGSGQIMDASGKMSGKIDIIIYRKDFPRLDLPGSRDIYLYESVIATIEVAAKLVKKSFFETLDRCASLADLNPQIDPKVITALAARNQLSLNENKQYVHPDPIRTARFSLIGRPLSFIYGFSGYKASTNMMVDTLSAWIQDRHENNKPVDLKSLPAVIATQGCFAWRNSAPFSMSNSSLMGVGFDAAPVRLIVLQLLHTLSRRLRVTTDAYGLKPALDGYLNRMPPPVIDLHVGKAVNPGTETPVVTERVTKTVAKVAEKPVHKPAQKLEQKTVKRAIKAAAAKPAMEKNSSPSPAPVKAAVEAPKTLTSLNVKPEPVDAPFPVPNAELIPELDPNPPEDGIKEPVPKPAVDIQLGEPIQQKSRSVAAVDSALPSSAANDFMETVKLNMAAPKKESAEEKSTSASEDFVETVKLNLSSKKEPFPDLQPKSEPEPEPFTSTIPQLTQ